MGHSFSRTLSGYILVTFSLLTLAGCVFEDQGTTVGTTVTTPADFNSTPADNNQLDQPLPMDELPTTTTLPPTSTTKPPRTKNFEADFVVNGGTVLTKNPVLHLEFPIIDLSIQSVKYGFTNDCSDGTWMEYIPSIDVMIPQKNVYLAVSAQYRDEDKTVSQCFVRDVAHDDQGPRIIISEYPLTSVEEGSTARVAYSVADVSRVTSVTCALNDLVKPCASGGNVVDITSLPAGNYTFKVSATDELGNSSAQQASWTVVSSTKHLTQSILVNNYNKVDILIVDDNSGSMAYEQQSMAQRTSNFLSILQGLDWRIAMTTTDPTATVSVNTTNSSVASGMAAPAGSKNVYKNVSDGLFLPIFGLPGQFYLDSTMNFSDAQMRLGKTLQRTEQGSGAEQGIFATYRAIERAVYDGAKNPVQKNFFREGAHLAVLVISDEDESANTNKNDPQKLMNLVQEAFHGDKAFSWHSIITKPDDYNCLNGEGESFGTRYFNLSKLTGGIVGSVCERDYAQQISGIANEIRGLVKTMTLTCQPLANKPVVVKKDGVVYTGSYTVEGVNLRFDAEIPPGQYSIDYDCLK